MRIRIMSGLERLVLGAKLTFTTRG